jgi:hypothetical protein
VNGEVAAEATLMCKMVDREMAAVVEAKRTAEVESKQ